jgi:hypothetical protein
MAIYIKLNRMTSLFQKLLLDKEILLMIIECKKNHKYFLNFKY